MKFLAAVAALPVLALAAPQPQFPSFPGFGSGTGSSAPAASGQADLSKKVEADLNAIKSATITLNNTVSTIGPNDPTISFGTLITLLGQSQNITSLLNSTTTDINNSAPFNGADAVQIGLQNIDLSNTVQSLLVNFQCRVQAFKNQGVAPTVAQNLQTAESGSGSYATAASSKVGILGGFGPLVSGPLNQKFEQTIALFNGSSTSTSCGQSTSTFPSF